MIKCSSAYSEIICVNLLKFYCLPIVMYSLEALNPSVTYLKSLDRLIDQAVMKIFKTFDMTIVKGVRHFCNLSSVAHILEKRKVNMFNRYWCNNLYFCKTVCRIYGFKKLLL